MSVEGFLQSIFYSNSFMPHGHCYLWKPDLVALHVISDSLIALAYYSIPLTLLYFVRKRRDLPFDWIFLLFGAFIILCGTTHILEVWTLWHATYWLTGFLKALTAGVSVVTAIVLYPLIPLALALPSPAQLEAEIVDRKQAEEALRQWRERFELAVLGSRDGLWDLNVQTNEMYFSPGWKRMLGYGDGELQDRGDEWVNRLHPDDRDRAIATISAYLESREPHYELEYRLLHKDGSYRWILARGVALFDASGEAYRMAGSHTDITDRKLAEETLRTSESELRALFAAMTDVILVLDGEGRYLKIAPTNPEMLYKPPAELIGKTLHEVFPKEQAEYFHNCIRRALRLREPLNIEYSLLVDNTEVWFATCVSPMAEDSVIWVARDISDRKRSEAALQKAKDELEKSYNVLRAVIDATPDPIFVKDLQGRHLSINDAGACTAGKTVEEIIGKDDCELFPPEVARQLMENDRRVIATGITEIFEESIYRLGEDATTEPRTYLSTKSVYRDTGGNIIGLVGIARDITTAKEAQDALKKAKEKLEIRVEERTRELKEAIAQLQEEISDRQRAEQALKTANQTLQTLIQASPLAIVTLNAQAHITLWNPAAERLFGWREAEVLGNPLPIIPREKQEEFRAILTAELRGEEKTGLELRRQKKDGSPIDISLWTSPILDSSGEVASIMALFADIGDRVRAETALRESRQLLEAIVDNSPAVIYLKDIQCRFMLVNRQFENLFHVDRGTIKGKNEYDLFPKEVADAFRENDLKVIASGTPLDIEEFAPHDDGLHAYISNKFLLYDSAGVPYALCGISTDITDRQRAVEALRESQRFNQQIAETSPNILYIYDLIENRNIYSNRQIAETLGYSPEAIAQMGGNVLAHLLHPDDVATCAEHLKRIVNSDGSGIFEVEYRMKDASGEWHWMYSRETVFARTVEGKPTQILGSAEDITRRKQAEEELRQSLKDLSDIKFALDRSALVAITDPTGKITYVNDKFCELSKYSREELIGQDHRIVNSGYHSRKLFQNLWAVIRSGKVWKGEIKNQAKDGSYYWVDTTIVPFLDESGKPSQYLAIRYDISDRKLAEEALKESEEQFRATFEQAGVGICHCGANTQFLKVNQRFCEIVGYSEEELLRLSFPDISYPEDAIAELKQFRALMAGEISTYSMEKRYISRGGEIIWVNLTVAAVRSSSGEAKYKVAVIQDISDRKRAEQEQQKLIALVENSSDFIGLATLEGEVMYANDAGIKLVGLGGIEEVKQTHILDYFLPEDKAEVEENILPAVMDAGRWEGEYRFRHFQTGESIPVLYHLFTLKDKQTDRPLALATVTRDISDRKQAEEELRQSEARFRDIALQQQLLNHLASQIRNSLEVNAILETAVREIRELLQVDRCNFTWFQVSASPPISAVVKEAREPHLPSFVGEYPLGKTDPFMEQMLNLEVIRIDDAQHSADPLEQELYRRWGCPSLVMLPIQTLGGDIGLFGCAHQTGARNWSDWEVELLVAVVRQLAIAIDQAELYKQSRTAAEIAQTKARELEQALGELKQAQAQLIQSEKMSSLGQLVAGVAHEINNPVNFIYGNITYTRQYAEELLDLIQMYRKSYPKPVAEIQNQLEAIDLDFIAEDLPKTLSSMKMGADRIRAIVLSLRNFSRLDESDMKQVDVHEGIDNTLLILQNRLKAKPNRPRIQVVKEYGKLPLVECYAGQLNQVFMNILANAIDALEMEAIEWGSGNGRKDSCPLPPQCAVPTIRIRTEVSDSKTVTISIADNGPGMTEEVKHRLFDPFFTTKPVGSGTGLGMSVSYQIVSKHGGQLQCISAPGEGAEFLIEIPILQKSA